jgi:multidrug efflux pump subunit AcrB
MLASYILSRTLVPTLAKFWLKKHDPGAKTKSRHFLARFQERFERAFEKMREKYRALLGITLRSGPRFAAIFLGAMAATALLAFPLGPLPGLGQDFFRQSTGARSSCTCVPAPARASRRPPRFAMRSRRRSAKSSQRANWALSSII